MSSLFKVKVGRATMILRGIEVDGEVWVAAADLGQRFAVTPAGKALPDWRGMLAHLVTRTIEPSAGERWPVGDWIRAEARMRPKPDPWRDGSCGVLARYGMRVDGTGDTAALVMANTHPLLASLFDGTEWRNGWKKAAQAVPGSITTGTRSFDGVASRACRIPFTSIPGFGAEAAR